MNLFVRFSILLFGLFVYSATALADCYTCFTRYHLELTLNNGTVLTGYTTTDYWENHKTTEEYLEANSKITLFEAFHASDDAVFNWKSSKPIPDFFVYSDDKTHNIETKDIASVVTLGIYSEEGIPFNLPNATLDNMKGKKTVHIELAQGLGDEPIGAEYYLLGLDSKIPQSALDTINDITLENLIVHDNGEQPWDLIVLEKLHLDPQRYFFVVISTGC
jgi:hypothetical protein